MKLRLIRNMMLRCGVAGFVGEFASRETWKAQGVSHDRRSPVLFIGIVPVGACAAAADDETATVVVWLQRYGPGGISVERHVIRTALWRSLPAVGAGRVVALPPTDFFGRLQTAARFAALLTDSLERYAA